MDNKILKSKHELVLFVLIMIIGVIMRINALNSYDYIIGPQDTFAPAAGSLDLINERGYNYSYLSSQGVSILLLPFILFLESYFAIKIAILFYSLLLVLFCYYLIKLFFNNPIPALIASFLISINPVFVTYSTVGFYDNIQLSFIFLFFIFTVFIQRCRGIMFKILFLLSGITLFFLKESNIVFICLSGIYLLVSNFLKIRKNEIKIVSFKKLFKNLIFFFILVLLAGSIYLGNSDSRYRAFEDVPNFFFSHGAYSDNIKSTFVYLEEPLITPSFAGIFKHTKIERNLSDNIIILFSIILFVGGLVFLLRENKNLFVLLNGIIISNIVFFTLFLKWQLRYYFPSLVSIIMIISFGIYLILFHPRYPKIISLFVIVIILLVSTTTITINLMNLNKFGTNESRIENYVLLDNKDVINLLEIARRDNVTRIYTSYGPWIDFFVLKEEVNISVIDVYRIVYFHDDINESSKLLINQIKGDVGSYKVWYIVGWQELFKNNQDDTRNYNELWNQVKSSVSLRKVYLGDNTICKSLLKYNCFEVYEIN